MSESVTEPLTIEEQQLFVAARIQSLVRDMSAFANNNPRFRRGLDDYVSVELSGVSATEAFEVDTEEDLDDSRIEDDSQQESLVDVKFEAERKRRILWAQPHVWVEFSLMVAKTDLNVELPERIAAEEYDMTPAEVAREIGFVRHTNMQMFRVNGRKRQVGLMQEVEYVDSDGDSISSVMIGQEVDDQVMYVARDNAADTGDTLHEPRIEQYATFQIENRTDSIPYEFKIDDEGAVALLVKMDEMSQDVDLMELEATVNSARKAFDDFRKAVLIQAGVRIADFKSSM